jgi:hypothetical protein
MECSGQSYGLRDSSTPSLVKCQSVRAVPRWTRQWTRLLASRPRQLPGKFPLRGGCGLRVKTHRCFFWKTSGCNKVLKKRRPSSVPRLARQVKGRGRVICSARLHSRSTDSWGEAGQSVRQIGIVALIDSVGGDPAVFRGRGAKLGRPSLHTGEGSGSRCALPRRSPCLCIAMVGKSIGPPG